jgi:hypothetical protein
MATFLSWEIGIASKLQIVKLRYGIKKLQACRMISVALGINIAFME